VAAWFKRFGFHLAAAVGATGVFVAAAAVGASQTRQQAALVSTPTAEVRPRAAPPRPRPSVVAATPTPAVRVNPERSLSGMVKDVGPDAIDLVGAGGRDWHVVPVPGALIRLNGKTARLETLQAGDSVVILGLAQPGRPGQFLAHAITARRK
jgi:hypothetical protein